MKKFLCMAAALLSTLALIVPAAAAPETKEIFTLDNTYNMAVSILFDKEMPQVSFTAPNGSVIDGASLTPDSGEDWVQYYIPNAAPGTWHITYDKGANTRFDISYSSYIDSIAISSFTLGVVEGDYLPVEFTVSGQAGSYQYQLYAVVTDTDGSLQGERLLDSGWATLHEPVTGNLYLGELADYGEYRLRLDVWQTYGVEEAYDSKLADGVFAVVGHTSSEAIENFFTLVDLTNGIVSIDWSDWAQRGDSILAVFYDGEAEPFYFTEITTGETYADALFDPGARALRIELTNRRNGQLSPVTAKTIVLDHGVTIDVPTVGLTNAQQARVEYTVTTDVKATILVGTQRDTVNLSGSGSFSVGLGADYNELILQYSTDDEFTLYQLSFEIIVDIIPPILRLPENKSALNTSESSFILSGSTEPGAAVSVAGVIITANDDGTFIHTVALSDGENVIKVTAADIAGNVTAQDVIINKVSAGFGGAIGDSGGLWGLVKSYLPLIASFLGSLVLLSAVLMIGRGYGKAGSKPLFLLGAIRNIAIGLSAILALGGGYTLWRYLDVKKLSEGEDYFALAKESIDSAYAALQDMLLYETILKYAAISLAVCVGLLILTIAAMEIIKRKKTIRQPAAEPQPIEAPDASHEPVITAAIEMPAEPPAGSPAVPPMQPAEPVMHAEAPPPSAEPPVFVCSQCGASFNSPLKFCRHCGSKM